MKVAEVKDYIKSNKKYDFLWNNPDICLVKLGGSISYGTYRVDEDGELLSDIDVRGVYMPPKEDIFGLTHQEQIEDASTDSVIFEFRKFISLLYNCNPNVIEMISPDKCNDIYVGEVGQRLIDNRQLFLSNIAAKSFAGYASSQLSRLKNAMAHDTYDKNELEEHMLQSLKRQMMSFEDHYDKFENGSVKIYLDASTNPELSQEIFMDCDLKHYPLRDYKGMWAEMQNVIKDYLKLTGRNKKKDDLHLCKHAMHLVRLYLMGIDIFENHEIITYRENDIPLLRSIRDGKYLVEEGRFSDEFFALVEEYDKKFMRSAENSTLPNIPNREKIEKFMVDVFSDYYKIG